jgi:hypothetical protein
MSAPKPASAPMVSVYDGTTCIGHVIARGKLGHEAFDREDKSVGVFETQSQAADALSADTAVSLPGEP